MTHDLKYIIKRIIIGVGIILVLSFLRSILILDVQAMEIEDGYTTPIVYVPEDTTLHKCDNFNTNYELSNEGFGACSNVYIPSVQLHYYSQFYPTLDLEYPYFAESSDNPNYGYNGDNAWYKNQSYHTLYNLVGMSISFYGRAFKIEPNHDYSIMIQIDKTNNVDYSYDTLNLEYLTLSMMDSNGSYYNISDYISNIKTQFVKGKNTKYEEDPTENPYYNNKSYYVIDFHVNSGIENLTNVSSIYFSNLAFYINKGIYDSDEGKYLLTNNKSIFSPESTGNIKTSITFIEGGHIDIEGVCDELSSHCSGIGYEYGGGLDGITLEDEKLFQEYETCEAIDIPCHLRNIMTAIKNLITRVGNGIKGFFTNITRALQNLFIPNFSKTWEDFNELKQVFDLKLGFIADTFTLLQNLVNKFLTIEDNTTGIINIPQINVPIFDRPIIEARQFNIKEIFEYGAIGTFYQIYKMFISVIISLLMLNYFKKEYDRVIRGYGNK